MQTLLFDHRHKIAAAIGVLILCALSFSLGRFNREETVRVEERIVEVEKVVEKVVYREKEETHVDEKKDTKKVTKRVATEVTKPDGTTEKKTEEIIDEGTTESKVEIKYVDRVVEVEKVVEKLVEVEKKVKASQTLPDWRAGLTVGVNPLDIYEARAVSYGDLILGAEVQRRLVGPVYGGVWGMTNGTVGINIGLEF